MKQYLYSLHPASGLTLRGIRCPAEIWPQAMNKCRIEHAASCVQVTKSDAHVAYWNISLRVRLFLSLPLFSVAFDFRKQLEFHVYNVIWAACPPSPQWPFSIDFLEELRSNVCCARGSRRPTWPAARCRRPPRPPRAACTAAMPPPAARRPPPPPSPQPGPPPPPARPCPTGSTLQPDLSDPHNHISYRFRDRVDHSLQPHPGPASHALRLNVLFRGCYRKLLLRFFFFQAFFVRAV